VVEAATENVELKLNIFKQLNDACSHDTILATKRFFHFNYSNWSVVTSERVIGMHFMNPVPIMKLVEEIIRGYNTSDEVTKPS
jgi:3-hydroxybutyryl-CoA dehydrogenase